MDKNLLGKEEREDYHEEEDRSLSREVKRVGSIAGPLVAINLSQYFLQIMSLMMVGHLGQLYLSSSAIAVSFSAVTGFSLVLSPFLCVYS
ncbi:hypothetical protein Ddye_030105 [Dipteronia dyeriana]|uniref:Uncharacterized protein n=1 Tax=Dipteronia dyeriana TaxID=168575 RepID=A0AAD9WME5_9ROSI|nr:hypothetical protein Ddye_030105 [Dipteronia dyeriana]